MQIRRYEPSLLQDALTLLERSDSTSRSRETWEQNGLGGVLAYADQRPLGIIPLEPRTFKISGKETVQALWVTGAHVDEEFRSQGIGAALDQEISRFYPQAQAIFAFRQDEGTRAFQWYMRRGYKPLCLILAFKQDIPVGIKDDFHFSVYEKPQDMQRLGPALLDLFNKTHGIFGGYVERNPKFWAHTQAFHYYREFYKYALLTLEEKGKIMGYAFLGETSMRDEIKRFDILELAAPGETLPHLLEGVFASAKKRKLTQVRLQCAATDPLKDDLEGLGFTVRWQTHIIGKELQSGALAKADFKHWRYFQVDYI
jgi:GNAT superfamily N-acetyltransferase